MPLTGGFQQHGHPCPMGARWRQSRASQTQRRGGTVIGWVSLTPVTNHGSGEPGATGHCGLRPVVNLGSPKTAHHHIEAEDQGRHRTVDELLPLAFSTLYSFWTAKPFPGGKGLIRLLVAGNLPQLPTLGHCSLRARAATSTFEYGGNVSRSSVRGIFLSYRREDAARFSREVLETLQCWAIGFQSMFRNRQR
jgi:hypothetical protein